MASNSSLILTSLDFDTLKNNLKTYLKNQETFKDYDFDGANMNVLLDILSYNTFINSFYLNMVASEMFLDTAQKFDSVVSHAKELNYLPQSNKSSEVSLNFSVDTVGVSGKLVIPRGTTFAGGNANGTYNFITAQSTSWVPSGNTYYITALKVYEGAHITDSFVMDYSAESQKFVLSNKDIDTNSLTINVIENNGASNTVYTRAIDLYGYDATSKIYFLQAAQGGKYEILFGDGIAGVIPHNGAIIHAQYRITNGSKANGITNFQCESDLGPVNGGIATISPITVYNSEPSSGGAEAENIDSIRFRAPRFYASQQRAVTSDDFASLLLTKFAGKVTDVTVYGGELLEPKQYGTVAVCIKPYGTTETAEVLRTEILNYLIKFVSIPTKVVITEPDYIFIKIDTIVQFDDTMTNFLPDDIKTVVSSSIETYSQTNLEMFGADFRYSRFVTAIDNSDISIISNDTTTTLYKKLVPLSGVPANIVTSFNNAVHVETSTDLEDEPSFYSSSFTYTSSISYNNCYMRDDGIGNIMIMQSVSGTIITVNPNAGTIDYENGTISLNLINVSDFGDNLTIYMKPRNKDLYAKNNKILIIEPTATNITVIDKLT